MTWNVKEFGAAGDGRADDTQALQRCLDAAGRQGGGRVVFPAGVYRSSMLKAPSHVVLCGDAAWEYRDAGGSVLRLSDPEAGCLIDVTDTFGVCLRGLSLDGDGLGDGVHGVAYQPEDCPPRETSFRVENCRISRFSGCGLDLRSIWVFTVRNSMISHNRGDAIRVSGADGLVHDCWISGNHGAGYNGERGVGNVTMTGNRIEWNRGGGVIVLGASHYNITGNYFDRCGGPGLTLAADASGQPPVIFTVTGNILNRCGAPHWRPLEEWERCQMLLRHVRGLTCVGNTMAVARDDARRGEWSPDYGVVYEALADSVIKDNAMHFGALKELLVDRGGNGDDVVVRDNPGRLFMPGRDVLRSWI